MKVGFSVLVGSLSGSSGDVTAANWKGRAYFRRRVIPTYSRTPDQAAVRLALTRTVACFQALDNEIRTFLDRVGTERQMSGYNAMMAACAKQERDDGFHIIIPANRYVPNLTGLVAETGATDGKIELTWDKANWLETDLVHFYVRHKNAETPPFYDTPWSLFEPMTEPKASNGAATVTGLTPGDMYAVACTVNRTVVIGELSFPGYSGGAVAEAEAGTTA